MSWRDFTSQPLVCDLLGRSIRHGRIHHAYLFVGEESETDAVALAFAQALNCERDDGDACGRCHSCLAIAEGKHPDVAAVKAESRSRQILIDQLREMERSIYLKASLARVKVAVIHTADRMNESAQNAFLKTLEEPPPQTVFLLLSEDFQRLRETVISRCLRVPFRPAPVRRKSEREEKLAGWLEEFLARSSPSPSVFRACGMSSRLLDLFAGVKEERKGAIEAAVDESVWDGLEPSQREKLEEQLEAQAQAEYLRERSRLLKDMLEWLHARGAGPSAAEIMEDLARRLSRNVNEPLAVEVAMLRLAEGAPMKAQG